MKDESTKRNKEVRSQRDDESTNEDDDEYTSEQEFFVEQLRGGGESIFIVLKQLCLF